MEDSWQQTFVQLVPFLGIALAVPALWASLRALRRRRLLQNLPTSKVEGVFIGLVELKGTAESESPLRSYLAEIPCVWYRWSVQEHWSRTVTETYTDSQGRTRTRTRTESGWKTVASGGDEQAFYLKDDTGVIRVIPERAEIDPLEVFSRTCGRSDPLYYEKGPSWAVPHSDHRRRFEEEAIPLHQPIYVVGYARERKDIVAPEIAYNPDAAMFLISCRSEENVVASHLYRAWGFGILGALLAAGGFAIRDSAAAGAFQIGGAAAAAGAYAVAWCAGWLWMAYNSLINLRQRVRQAASLVDVELKRRHDLIPRLVEVVEGIRAHERTVQTLLAELRSQASATLPGAPGPDPRGCVPLLRALVENYPELRAQENFLYLQEELTRTEQRIALARSYYNEIATQYNTRIASIPDRWLAPLAAMRAQPLIAAADFERAPVEVSLAGAQT